MNSELKKMILGGTILAIVYIFYIFTSGQTFGQRAAKKYEWGTPEWKEEILRLAKGKK